MEPNDEQRGDAGAVPTTTAAPGTAPIDAPIPPPPTPRRSRTGVVVAVVAVIVLAGVAAIIGLNTVADKDSHQTTTSSPVSVEEPPIAAPGDATADPGAFQVVLTWKPGAGEPPDGFTVYRDGDAIGIAEPTEHRFVDREAQPSTRYRYVVRAYAGEFGLESKGASVAVRTRSAPPALARFQGTFDVRLKVASSFGLTGVGGRTAAWRITPDCKQGACRVRFNDLNGPVPSTDLDKHGAGYDGDVSGASGFSCGDVAGNGSWHVHLHVDRAATVAGRWRAVKFSGTISVSIAQQLGCSSGGATYDAVGTLHS